MMLYCGFLILILLLIIASEKRKERRYRAQQESRANINCDAARADKILRGKKRENRALTICISILFILVLIPIISIYCCINVKSCSCNSYWQSEFVYGDFVCQEYGDEILIAGLSDAGKAKKTIVLPERIRGRKVFAVDDRAGQKRAQLFASENLQTLYYSNLAFRESFDYFPNLKRIFAANPNCVFGKVSSEVDVYVCEDFFQYYRNMEFEDFGSLKRANVLYSMNVSGGADDVLWVSEEKYGGLIANFIPNNPYLEGYNFGGWFKDSRCTEPWDFAKDRVPVSAFAEDGVSPYHQLVLYAKWNRY